MWRFPSTNRAVSAQRLIQVVARTRFPQQPERLPLERPCERLLLGSDRAEPAPRPTRREKEKEQPKYNARPLLEQKQNQTQSAFHSRMVPIHQGVAQACTGCRGSKIQDRLVLLTQLQVNQGVPDLVLHISQLRFHAFNLLARAGELTFHIKDILQLVRALGKKVGQALFGIACVLPARIQVYMLLGYFFTALFLLVDVANVSQLAEGGIQLADRHPQRGRKRAPRLGLPFGV